MTSFRGLETFFYKPREATKALGKDQISIFLKTLPVATWRMDSWRTRKEARGPAGILLKAFRKEMLDSVVEEGDRRGQL